MPNIYEWRGVKGLVAAEVLTDDATNGYTTGTVFEIAGVAEVTRNVESSMDTHYYDNYGAVVVDSVPTDNLSISASAIPADVYAKLSGATYDPYTGMLIVGKHAPKYFAVGYIAEDTNGNEHYVWHLKGKFAVGGVTHSTKNNSTDASGQTLTYNAVKTATQFVKGGDGANSVQVNTGLGLADVDDFFTTVQTPDTVLPLAAYELEFSTGVGASVPSVKRNGVALNAGAVIYAGDQLEISVLAGSSLTVNGNAWISGDIHVVAGDVTVASTKNN